MKMCGFKWIDDRNFDKHPEHECVLPPGHPGYEEATTHACICEIGNFMGQL